ncbi:MAG: FAD:protein transferase [Gaiellales bacterium]|nr:FAD:protein transferase [Gaiellales bacterium]
MSAPTYRFRALGTTAQVTVADRAGLRTAGALLHDELETIDRACSRFLATSELNAVNAGAGAPVGVSSVLFEAVATALHAAEATGGAVDPTVGGSLRSLGYDCDFALIGTDDGRRQVVRLRRRTMSWKRVRLDRERHTISIPRGVELDLGATGKAFAADRAAQRIADAIGSGVLVSLGGDIAVAGDPPSEGWPIRVTDDHRDLDGAGPTIALRNGGLATSSTTVRRWSVDGVERHHIVDPRTGRPAPEVWRTASVAAATCVDANAASTAAIVLGEEAPAWLARLGLAARLVRGNGDVVAVAGWPAAEAVR